MAWTPFSAEAVMLHAALLTLTREGRTSAAVELIVQALETAHRDGPSHIPYEDFERQVIAPKDDQKKSTT